MTRYRYERVVDNRQVDLEEVIAAKGGKPYTPPRPTLTTGGDGSDPYGVLRDILNDAYLQCATGKGRERHANGRPFMDQPIMEITRAHGIGFPTGQAAKKAQEAIGMLVRGEVDAARRELLGAIVYLAAACASIDEVACGSDVDNKVAE